MRAAARRPHREERRLLLGQVPERRVRRRLDDVAQAVLAICRIQEKLAHWHVGDVLHKGGMVLGQAFLECIRAGAEVAQLIQQSGGPGRARPAEPGLVAGRGDIGVSPGILEGGVAGGGVEDVPARRVRGGGGRGGKG